MGQRVEWVTFLDGSTHVGHGINESTGPKSVWDECIEVPHATKSVWDESHTSHTVPAPMAGIQSEPALLLRLSRLICFKTRSGVVKQEALRHLSFFVFGVYLSLSIKPLSLVNTLLNQSTNQSINVYLHVGFYSKQEIRSVERGYLSHCCSAWPNL